MISILFVKLYVVNSLDLGNAFLNKCQCQNLLTQAECTNELCNWSNGACTTPSCSSYNSTACSQSTNCVYFNNSCVAWTKCSDYNTTANSRVCENMGGQCEASYYSVYNQSNVILYGCQDQVINCERLNQINCTLQAACFYFIPLNWCKPKYCSDITTQESCTYVNPGTLQQATLCSWNSTIQTCGDAPDVTHLTASTCNLQTQMSYSWNPTTQKCVSCSKKSNRGIISSVLALALIIMG